MAITGETYDVEHEFIEASRNPGIGAHMRNSASVRKGFLSVDGVPRALPRYFLEYLKDNDPRFYEELKNQRFDHAQRQPIISQDEKIDVMHIINNCNRQKSAIDY